MSLSPLSTSLACLYGDRTVCVWNFPEITLVTCIKFRIICSWQIYCVIINISFDILSILIIIYVCTILSFVIILIIYNR